MADTRSCDAAPRDCYSPLLLVNGVCMGAALTGMVLFSSADAGTSAWVALPFAVVWLFGGGLAVAFFRSGRERSPVGGRPRTLRGGDDHQLTV